MNRKIYATVNAELSNNFQKIWEIRNQAANRLIELKENYIAAGGDDEIILRLYDTEINFILSTVREISGGMN